MDLLQTIPDFAWPRACAVLAEIVPEPAQDFPDEVHPHYGDPGIDYEQLHTDRYAPRWLAQMHKFGYVSAPATLAQRA